MKCDILDNANANARSLPVRGAWIEILKSISVTSFCPSLPVRGAWIEIWARRTHNVDSAVAPRAGSVD